MKADTARMLLDSYFNARTRRIDLLRSPKPKTKKEAEVREWDQGQANVAYGQIRDELIGYLKQVEHKP